MKYPTLLILVIMFILGSIILISVPYIFSNLEEGYQAIITVVAVLVLWGWIGVWYNRRS